MGVVPENDAQVKISNGWKSVVDQNIESVFGKRYVDTTFDNYEIYDNRQTNAVSICRKYSERIDDIMRNGKSIVFAGKSGTGKDHLVVSICRMLIEKRIKIEAEKFYVLIDEALEAQQAGGWKKAADRYCEAEFLVLSEIGVQRTGGTDFERKVLYHVIDERYRSMRPFILTTNLDTAALRDTVDPPGYTRIWDRLTEIAAILPFDWESYRERTREGK
jgi:DNA replication protein DnaC